MCVFEKIAACMKGRLRCSALGECKCNQLSQVGPDIRRSS